MNYTHCKVDQKEKGDLSCWKACQCSVYNKQVYRSLRALIKAEFAQKLQWSCLSPSLKTPESINPLGSLQLLRLCSDSSLSGEKHAQGFHTVVQSGCCLSSDRVEQLDSRWIERRRSRRQTGLLAERTEWCYFRNWTNICLVPVSSQTHECNT